MSQTAQPFAERLADVQARITAAEQRADRPSGSVTLVAVTKTHGLDAVREAYAAGLRHFGENRVEEAEAKIAALRSELPAEPVWHMIGSIQSRKAGQVGALFSWVHAIDRLKVAQRISQAAVGRGQTLDVLLQVNTSGEASKSGFELANWAADDGQYSAFLREAESICSLEGLRVSGLMTMAPYALNPEEARPVFRRTCGLWQDAPLRLGLAPWPHLSMGMSGDFEVAVEEGATIVRLGTSLFGQRGP